MATRRPPSASRASADDTWRSAASVRRRSTLASAENGGFISTTVGVTPGSRWSSIRAASKRVTPTSGKRWPSRPARVSASSFRTSEAPASSAKMASSPVPADGSRTWSEGDDRCSRARDKCQRNRRGELLQLLALDGAPRVAGEQPRHPGEHRQQRGGRSGARRHGAAELAQEQHRGRLAGVVGALPVPAALGVGGADGVLHRGAKNRRIDRVSAFEGGQQQPGGVDEGGRAGRCVGHRGAGRGKGCRGGGGRRHDGSLG